MTDTRDVLFSEMKGMGGDLGIITLNRPAVLNSLNHDMIIAMRQALDAWAISPTIKAVVIQAAEGRAFCAGGDIRVVYDHAKQHHPLMTDFFFDEYHLNRTIFHFPKPYIALQDGITMGGGVGVSIHGSHRVMTERVLFAMPETGIGFFPDVGGTYFLPRLKAAAGYWLGLTGARIKTDDCHHLGLATHQVNHEMMPTILDALINTDFGTRADEAVTHLLSNYSKQPAETAWQMAADEMQTCFSASTIEEIIERLKAASHPLCQDAYDAIQKKSPTSLKVTLQAFNQGKNMNFDACMQQEYRLVTRFLLAHDFVEGIRAVIVDKDQAPAWLPATLKEVSRASIDEYFAPLKKELA